MTTQTNLFDIIPNGTAKFFNTINVKNPELAKYKRDAKTQEEIIMRVFESGEKYTALHVKRITGLNQDSCKRAITCLYKKGKLIKLNEMVIEEFGKPNHLWVKR